MKNLCGKLKISVDGLSGSGKSTIGRMLAEHFNLPHLDTGRLYRIVAYLTIKNLRANNTSLNEYSVETLATKFAENIDLYLDEYYHSKLIYSNEVSEFASIVSAIASVRSALIEYQRNFGNENGAVLDGRDIGTTILPDAMFKIFVVASIEARAKRRFAELISHGRDVLYEDVYNGLLKRDKMDMNRCISPLSIPDKAMHIDTSNISAETAISLILKSIGGQ